jgi:hypothetical protein
MQDVRKERPGKNTKEIITREICIQHGITEKYVVCPQRPVFHSLNGKKKSTPLNAHMGYGSFQMNLSSHREMWHSFLAP